MTSWTQVTEAVRVAVEAARDKLNRLDAAAGDGDLGVTMTAAAQGAAALAARGDLAGKTTGQALSALGRELARCAPSTSGTLLARGLLAAGREADGQAAEPPVAQAAALVRAAMAGIERAGRAAPGDRTLLDALAPLAAALQDAADRGEAPAAAAAAGAAAAQAGAAATADLEPKVGRASWIPDRARGNVDAGAQAIAIIAAAVASTVS